ncbi:MAG: multidrug ABC transporter ATP-binding protein [Archangium gephyra]|uniref:Multidrug ABC transporter ATP-binding protein n=1 Tax=Archangium gephyra TaxID=48 RepID=A0A2W5UPB5_9BACT|nr:MAG: multidrug ABC transporter ATP-binding protein [Archangium gephyra]
MIEVENLTKQYRDRVAIDALNFRIKEGQIVGFLGPNGAGKSTTMKILTGFMPPTSGKAKVAGFDVFENPLEAKKRIGYLPETPPLYPELTVREYLKFVCELKGIARAKVKDEIQRVATGTGVVPELDRLTGTLSKGYRQRVGIAQAMLGGPALLILDEPTEGLDPRQRREVLELIKSLKGKHTVVLSTHILAEVKAICEQVLIIHRGKIVADDTMANITGGNETGLEDKFIQLTSE